MNIKQIQKSSLLINYFDFIFPIQVAKETVCIEKKNKFFDEIWLVGCVLWHINPWGVILIPNAVYIYICLIK